MLAALSEDSSWFSERVNVIILLAPIARVDNATS
jgi:hypothetical protein